MAKSENQKIKLPLLFDILKMYSDEDHPLSTNELIRLLGERGVKAGRKALYEDIKLLNDFGYEVLTVRSRSNFYYVVDRKFDAAELRILVDAVASADFITEVKTKQLTEKIASLAGANKAEILTGRIVYSDTAKHSNEKLFYWVDSLDKAIETKTKVRFRYFDLDCHGQRSYRKDGDYYEVNPVGLIFNDNKYYLVAYSDKYLNLANYRVDRMDDVKNLPDKITPADCAKDFNANVHRKQAFSMYMGKPEKVTFCVEEKSLDVIFDKFGEKTHFYYHDGKDSGLFKFYANVQVSPSFFGWCAQLGTKLRILEPQAVADEYAAYLRAIADSYRS